jgi:hypothetical protein
MPKIIPSAAYLHACLTYAPDTGDLTWKPRPREHFRSDHAWKSWNARFPGQIAGSPDVRKYLILCIDDIRYKAHRVIWMMQTGDQPPSLLDHRRRGPTENRWVNLRPATPQQNTFNQRKRVGLPLPKGVCSQGKRYRSTAGLNGRKISLGMSGTPDEASDLYRAFAIVQHGEFFFEGEE